MRKLAPPFPDLGQVYGRCSIAVRYQGMSAGGLSTATPAETATVSNTMQWEHGHAVFGIQHRGISQGHIILEARRSRVGEGVSLDGARLILKERFAMRCVFSGDIGHPCHVA